MGFYMKNLLKKFCNIDEVETVAVGGSSAVKTADDKSDIDVYVFSRSGVTLKEREKIIKPVSSNYEIGGEYFGSGDEFWADEIGRQFDIMYWDMSWFESVVENTWVKHYPSNGYTTCFLYTLKNFDIIYDKNGWLSGLQSKIDTPYPKELRENIIRRNLMLMKDKPFASYYEQIDKALHRGDYVSVNHRLAAFVASYFDVIFAANEQLHPGEKRLVRYVKENCKKIPKDFEQNLLQALTVPDNLLQTLNKITTEVKKIV